MQFTDRREILTCVKICMNLENISLSEREQARKQKMLWMLLFLKPGRVKHTEVGCRMIVIRPQIRTRM